MRCRGSAGARPSEPRAGVRRLPRPPGAAARRRFAAGTRRTSGWPRRCSRTSPTPDKAAARATSTSGWTSAGRARAARTRSSAGTTAVTNRRGAPTRPSATRSRRTSRSRCTTSCRGRRRPPTGGTAVRSSSCAPGAPCRRDIPRQREPAERYHARLGDTGVARASDTGATTAALYPMGRTVWPSAVVKVRPLMSLVGGWLASATAPAVHGRTT